MKDDTLWSIEIMSIEENDFFVLENNNKSLCCMSAEIEIWDENKKINNNNEFIPIPIGFDSPINAMLYIQKHFPKAQHKNLLKTIKPASIAVKIDENPFIAIFRPILYTCPHCNNNSITGEFTNKPGYIRCSKCKTIIPVACSKK